MLTDLFYIALTLAFLVASWGLIVVCERLMEEKI